ncbi:HAD-IA family hydrolase [Niallia sp. Sow4_A1]|jgi:HAD superfamily hydrolase (TIGR01509 family)|uniref:HAD-IA family hydrolase n=1 Tax=Niallia hominis TaxID=3133173 RepID=A0ABV1F1C4_9BACI|nr:MULTISPECIES: HAD-IA family hydrolase [Bacillaceae]MCM3362792.1 HAD-IA family hydrolase [Niallia sp. MER TA 168]CAI9396595.1 Phosphoglycolate phosphatase [Bacillus sp. T2.9-1]
MNILWDFDGTLFDTYPAYTEVLYKILGEKIEKDSIYKELKVSFSHAIQFFGLTEQQIKEIKTMNKEIDVSAVKPFPGVEEILKKADTNVIMTHKSYAGVTHFLRHYGWEKYFAEIVTLENGFPRKPAVDSYHYLHTKYSIDLAIGDRELDLIPANKLGIQTCMFQNQCEIADFHLVDYADFFTVYPVTDKA